MKNKILYLIIFSLSFLSCKAQTISLDQISHCQNVNCPDYTAVVDSNNLLNKFAGVWKGTSMTGKIYEFHFSKKLGLSLYSGKPWDRIIGRMLVKDSGSYGVEYENTLNTGDSDTHFNGFEFVQNLTKYKMYYSGNAECNDKGYVYLFFPNPTNLNELKLVFIRDSDIIKTCPNGYSTVIPHSEALILTKQ